MANDDGPLRVVLERDSSSGIEQAAIVFLENSVQVTINSNFFENEDETFYLGKFEIPLNKELASLKVILEADYLELSKQKKIIDKLGAKEQTTPNPHREYIYLKTYNTVTNHKMNDSWKRKLGAVFDMLEKKHAKDAIMVKAGKEKLKIQNLNTNKSSAIECKQKICTIENYGKVVK
jgi:hypothetical protein